MRTLRCALVLGVLATVSACSESRDCSYTDAGIAFGLSVTVRNGNNLVCDATVTATDGSYSETLRRQNSDCSYAGAAERPGTYSVTATAGSTTATVTGVRVGSDRCHVGLEVVTIQLNP